MHRVLIAAFAVAAAGCAEEQGPAPRDAGVSERIRETVSEIVAEHGLPGMIAAIADSEGVIGIGAAGVRKAGTDAAMTVDDLVHIGSCTKAMTSTVLATLIAEGELSWDTRLAEAIPALKDEIHAGYQDVTLRQLVTHRAGIPANAASWWAHQDMELSARRLQHLKDNLKAAPRNPEGEYLYSNLGYVAAGCMAEAVTGKTWETLIRERLFEPLGMASAGFGPPGAAGALEEPWGHVRVREEWISSQRDNAEALGPAGRVHCTLADWAKFAALQLRASDPAVLTREQLDELTQPAGDYAAGWGVVERDWAGGRAFTHSGSNTMWYATVWVAPETDRVYLAAINAGGDLAARVCDLTIGKLIAIDKRRLEAE